MSLLAGLAKVAGSIVSGAAPVFLLLAVAALRPRIGERPARALGGLISRLARARVTACAASGALSFVIAAAYGALVRLPVPAIHDEFAYLLAADTFAHGRLANPHHPMSAFLETFYVLQEPTYSAMYPPAPGLFLAAGQLATGLPVVGVWLAAALACAALTWALFSWLPPRWAVVGGLLAAVHPLVFAWSESYWGGAVGMLGGALLLGALGRLRAAPRAHHGVVLAVGLAILANTRPFEGLVLAVLTCPALVIAVARRRVPLGRLVPGALVLAVALVATAAYDRAVTGSPLRMPHAVWANANAVVPAFVWQPLRPEPAYPNEVIRSLMTSDEYVVAGRRQRTPAGFLASIKAKVDILASGTVFPGYLPWAPLGVPLSAAIALGAVVLPALLRARHSRRGLALGALFFAAMTPVAWTWPHYVAPAAPLFFLLGVQTLRVVRTWRAGARGRRPIGPFGVACFRGVVFLGLAALVATAWRVEAGYRGEKAWAVRRAEIAQRLARGGERNLVLVGYGPRHDPHDEWVYNGADVDGSAVVWARDLGAERNAELLRYFAGRRVWRIDADAARPEPELLRPAGGR